MREKISIYFIAKNLMALIIGFVEVLLIFRLVLKLFGAQPHAEFVHWIYETTRTLITPFLGMFPSPELESKFILEFNTLFAIITYLILYLAIYQFISFLELLSKRNTPEL
jgi:hypothetical protein